jgi:hypothetical protein
VLAQRYLADKAPTTLKPRSIREYEEYEKTLKNYVLPTLGMKRVSEVTRADVETLRNRLREKPYSCNRALSMTSVLMNCAIGWGLRPEGTNPAFGIVRMSEKHRETSFRTRYSNPWVWR